MNQLVEPVLVTFLVAVEVLLLRAHAHSGWFGVWPGLSDSPRPFDPPELVFPAAGPGRRAQ
jgi:hypothetical protein